MGIQPWGFGPGSLDMDLEKMNAKFKTQKIWTLEPKPRISIHANNLDKPK